MKNDKVTGNCEITVEMLKASGGVETRMVIDLMNTILRGHSRESLAEECDC